MSETAEERERVIDYLTTSYTVWRTVATYHAGTLLDVNILRAETYSSQYPLVCSTFFYGVRGNTAPRLYMWGDVGSFGSYWRQPMWPLGFSTVLLVSAASSAARSQVFPNSASHPGLSAPNTEEFLDRGAVHRPLADVVSISAFDSAVVMACDASGHIYVRGDVTIDPSTDDNPNLGLNPTYNQLGLGPRRKTYDDFVYSGTRLASPCKQYSLQRVMGDSPSFGAVKFVKVAATYSACAALSEDGHIWFSGDASRVSRSDEFPDEPATNRQFSYYRKNVVSQWDDIHGSLQSGELTFSDFWLSAIDATFGCVLALTKDGRLFVHGNSVRGYGAATSNTRYRQIGGFIDTIVPKLGNDNALPAFGGFTVSISIAPPPNGGTIATATPIIRTVSGQRRLFGVRLDNPGSGYIDPPAVTVQYGSTQRTDIVSCTVFSGTWKTAHMNSDNYAAVSSDGVLYLWGTAAYNNAITKASYGSVTGTLAANGRTFNAPIRATQFQQFGEPIPQQSDTYERVAVLGTVFGTFLGGVAIGAGGGLTYWGAANRTPNGTLTRELTQWPGATYIDCATSGANQIGLIDSDNDAYTYGANTSALGHGSQVSDSLGIASYRSITKVVGSAKWSRIFGIDGFRRGFYAVRLPEALDEFGVRKNPLPPYGS